MARILVVSNLYPPHHYGGYELSCRDVVGRWRAKGHRVDVLTSNLRLDGVHEPEEPGVRRVLRSSWEDHRFRRRPLPLVALDERHDHDVVRSVLAETGPDVVSVWNLPGLPLSLLSVVEAAGVPVLLVVCNEWLDFWPAIDPWFRRSRRVGGRLLARVLRLPIDPPAPAGATVCFVSEWLRQRSPAVGRSTVVYSGIDHDDFPVPDVAPPAPPWGWRLLYVGRIDRDKGIETAVHALARLPEEATLAVVGRGDARERARLERVAASTGVASRVTFGSAGRGELPAVYRAADVVVFPSAWEEPFGLVPVEAMACAVLVVATGTGGSGEFLLDGVNALRVPPGDAAALAAAVCRLADDPALRERLRAGGLSTARQLGVDRLADVLEAWHLAAASRFAEGVPDDRPAPALP